MSDGVDGFIARTSTMRSELGAYLDPMADKMLLVSIYVVAGHHRGNCRSGWSILVVSRDALIVGAVMLSWSWASR